MIQYIKVVVSQWLRNHLAKVGFRGSTPLYHIKLKLLLTMNFRRAELLDRLGLVPGSEIPPPVWGVYKETERVNKGIYERSWSFISYTPTCHEHLESWSEAGETFRMRAKKTCNKKLLALLQDRIVFGVEKDFVEVYNAN